MLEGSQPLNLSPESSQCYRLAEKLPTLNKPGQLWLNVEIRQPKETPWSPAQHRSAWHQWRLPQPLFSPSSDLTNATAHYAPQLQHNLQLQHDLQLQQDEQHIKVTYQQQCWQFSRQTGRLAQWWVADKPMLLRPLQDQLCVRRWITISVSAKLRILTPMLGLSAGRKPECINSSNAASLYT